MVKLMRTAPALKPYPPNAVLRGDLARPVGGACRTLRLRKKHFKHWLRVQLTLLCGRVPFLS